MKITTKDLLNKLVGPLSYIRRYAVMIFIMVMLLIISFFVFRISQYSREEPSEQAIDEKLQTVQRPRIDKTVVEKIQLLQSENIKVQSLFDQARNNPFNE